MASVADGTLAVVHAVDVGQKYMARATVTAPMHHVWEPEHVEELRQLPPTSRTRRALQMWLATAQWQLVQVLPGDMVQGAASVGDTQSTAAAKLSPAARVKAVLADVMAHPPSPPPTCIVVEAQHEKQTANVRTSDAVATSLLAWSTLCCGEGAVPASLVFQSGGTKMKVVDAVLQGVSSPLVMRNDRGKDATGVTLKRLQLLAAPGTVSGVSRKDGPALAKVHIEPSGAVWSTTPRGVSDGTWCSDAALQRPQHASAPPPPITPAPPRSAVDSTQAALAAMDPWAHTPEVAHNPPAPLKRVDSAAAAAAPPSPLTQRPPSEANATQAARPPRARCTTSSSTYIQNKTSSQSTFLELLWARRSTAQCAWDLLLALPASHRHDVADAVLHALWCLFADTALGTLPKLTRRRG